MRETMLACVGRWRVGGRRRSRISYALRHTGFDAGRDYNAANDSESGSQVFASRRTDRSGATGKQGAVGGVYGRL